MNRAGIVFSVVIAILTVALWGLLNLPSEEPPWPSSIQGFSFQPMRADQTFGFSFAFLGQFNVSIVNIQ